MTQKFKNLNENQHTEIFAVVKFCLVKLQNFYDNVTSFFLTQFNLKLVIKIVQWFTVKTVKFIYYGDAKLTVTFFGVNSIFRYKRPKRAVGTLLVWPHVSNHIYLHKFMRTRVGSPFTDIENAPQLNFTRQLSTRRY